MTSNIENSPGLESSTQSNQKVDSSSGDFISGSSSWNHGDIIDISPSRSANYIAVSIRGEEHSSQKPQSSQQHSFSPSIRLIVDGQGFAGSGVALATPERPYDRVCVRPNGNVFFFRGTSKGCMFIVEQPTTSSKNADKSASSTNTASDNIIDRKPIVDNSRTTSVIRLRSTVKVGGGTVYLTCSPSGELQTTGSEDPRSFLDSLPAEGGVITFQRTDPSPLPGLEDWQLSRFEDEGFLVVESVVDSEFVENCQRLLMHNLGVPGAVSAGN